MSGWLAFVLLAGCAASSDLADARKDFVIDTLASDNREWALREPELVREKLLKMQRTPFMWLRGTGAVYWREAMTPGARAPTAFGSVASSRVLLQGDPHPENLGSFRAADGTFVIDFNDFDSAGYGPYELEVRRLAIGMLVATNNAATARAVGLAYANQINGIPVTGDDPYLDALIAKAKKNGDAHKELDAVAPVGPDGTRAIAFGNQDPVGADGVIENRLDPVGAEAAVWIADAVAQWSGGARTVQLQARRLGSGVASYAALRYVVVLDDESVIELKEERDGLIIAGLPELEPARWSTPGIRVVATQRELQVRPDEDTLLGSAEVGALSLRIHDCEDYQRGVDNLELGALPGDQQVALAARFAARLADAHAHAPTQDGILGQDAIGPLLAGRADAFADEIATTASADAAQLAQDFADLSMIDLAQQVLP